MTFDRYGRNLHYLRISLTDHCNLRCLYCMPEETTFQPNAALLRDDEIIRMARLFAGAGFDKFRLTGGEPTVRPQLVRLVEAIAHLPGVRSLSMTSNGVLFARMAEALRKAGLNRVNFSLDTLNPEKFARLTRRNSLQDVWSGIQAAEAVGLTPVKINAVVMRGYNEEDVPGLAGLTLEHAWQVRFIEMMPFAGATGFQLNQVVTAGEIQQMIETALGPLEPVKNGELDGEARLYKLPGSRGEIGLISTVSQPFCTSCSRARLTADGRLRLCLLDEAEVDLLTPLRAGASDAEISSLINESLWNKPMGHRLADGIVPLNRTMGAIGG